MPAHDRKSPGERIVAGVIAVGLAALVMLGLATGDISSSRHPELKQAENPVYFWLYIGLFAGSALYAALLSLGLVTMKTPPNYEAHLRRETISKFTFLALLGAAGSGWAWLSERLNGSTNLVTEIAGWIALGLLGLATLPPHLSPGPARAALRGAGIAVVLVSALMIFRLMF